MNGWGGFSFLEETKALRLAGLPSAISTNVRSSTAISFSGELRFWAQDKQVEPASVKDNGNERRKYHGVCVV
jgi:hypothetical protein